MTLTIIKTDNPFSNESEEQAIELNESILKKISGSFKQFLKALSFYPPILTKELEETFQLELWQQKLSDLLLTETLQNELRNLDDQAVPIRLYIRNNNGGLPLAIQIVYGSFFEIIDLQSMADEIARRKKYHLSYVYEEETVLEDFYYVIDAIKQSSLITERAEYIRKFNENWQGQLHFSYLAKSRSARGDDVTFTITDVSGKIVEETTHYPVKIAKDLHEAIKVQENPISKAKNICAFFNQANGYKATACAAIAGAVATGLYFLGNS